MGIRPIDFQLSFLNLQRMEQVQSVQDQYASVVQMHLVKELEKKKKEEEETVNEVRETDNTRLDSEPRKETRVTLYNMKKKRDRYDERRILNKTA